MQNIGFYAVGELIWYKLASDNFQIFFDTSNIPTFWIHL